MRLGLLSVRAWVYTLRRDTQAGGVRLGRYAIAYNTKRSRLILARKRLLSRFYLHRFKHNTNLALVFTGYNGAWSNSGNNLPCVHHWKLSHTPRGFQNYRDLSTCRHGFALSCGFYIQYSRWAKTLDHNIVCKTHLFIAKFRLMLKNSTSSNHGYHGHNQYSDLWINDKPNPVFYDQSCFM